MSGKQLAPCGHCGLLIVATGEHRFPCAWCGRMGAPTVEELAAKVKEGLDRPSRRAGSVIALSVLAARASSREAAE